MPILPYLKNRHLETLKSALHIHNMFSTNNSCIIGKHTWDNFCENVDCGSVSDELVQRYKLAEYASSNDSLTRDESLQLALDICLETGITKEEFDLAREYNITAEKSSNLELN